MYRAVQNVYPNKVVNYSDLVSQMEKEHGFLFVYKLAYGKQAPERAQPFITFMRTHGFEVNIGNCFWNTEIGVKAASILPNVEALVLCSGYYEHGAVLTYARAQGKLTYVMCPDIPKFFKNHADILPFPANTLKDRRHEPTETAKSVELSPRSSGDGFGS